MKRGRGSEPSHEGGASSSGETQRLPVDSDDELDCELAVSRAEAEEKLCQQRREPPEKVAVRTRPETDRGARLLQDHQTAPVDECYTSEEVALSEYQKLHSVCATEATSASTLQLLGDLAGRQMIRTKTLEKIPKSHDDQFLRPPKKAIGERACVCGKRCLARVIATMRFGKDAPCGFTCVEFLSPRQLEDFKTGKGLPPRRGKCLLCIRYFTSYVYQLAKMDPNFLEKAANFDVQLFENCVASRSDAKPDELEAEARAVPHAASVVSDGGGYRPDVCLFADEAFLNTSAGRGDLASLAWRPVVRFRSLDYKYTKDADGNSMIVQCRMGVDHTERSGGSPFRQPPVASAAAAGGEARRSASVHA